MISYSSKIFDRFASFWESKQNVRNQSHILVAVFVLTIIISTANYFDLITFNYFLSHISFNDAIEYSFNFLLLFEIIGLVLAIPKSIASSIAKQFQILSLILLRTSFEELSNLSLYNNFQEQFFIIQRMAADSAGAIIIFILTHWFYKLQKHRKITSETDMSTFINYKKIIALGVMAALLIWVLFDIFIFLKSGMFRPSYAKFYLILIFSDMLLMLIAFRYVIHYPNIFRYSAFVLITIFIRIALVAPVYYNVLIGICSVLFGIGVAYTHNLFINARLKTVNPNTLKNYGE